jgi:preprotein translocase subunit SecF
MFRFRIVPDNTKIQFMKGRIAGLAVSAVLSLASLVLWYHPGLSYGVDFQGGIIFEVRTQQPADFANIRSALSPLNLGEVGLQQLGSQNDFLIRLEQQRGGEEAQQKAITEVRNTLTKAVPGTEFRRVEAVGATISQELWNNGMLAMGLALVAMLAYIAFRFQWQFGVGAVATLILDVTKIVGVYAVTQLPFNLTSIAAILTIMGFSINDKVVVYDRVRENLRKYKSMPLRQLIDQSINETLNRTINTSLTTFLATLPLAIFGGESVQGFAIVILIGIVIGTSSSIFIAAPILLFLGENRLRREAAPPAAPPGGAAAKKA